MSEQTLQPAVTMPDDHLPNHQSSTGQRLRPLWFSVLVGPLVYSIYFLIGYMIAEAACKADLLNFTLLGMDGLAVTELLLTVISVVIISSGFVIAWRSWRSRRAQGDGGQGSDESARHFLAFGGLVLNPLFILVTGATGGALLFLQPCSWM